MDCETLKQPYNFIYSDIFTCLVLRIFKRLNIQQVQFCEAIS